MERILIENFEAVRYKQVEDLEGDGATSVLMIQHKQLHQRCL